MKLTTLMLFVTLLPAWASLHSQQTKISLEVNNGNISDVFNAIENQSDFKVFYNVNQLNLEQRVDYKAKDAPISNVLADLLGSMDVSYELYDKIIVIVPSELKQGIKVSGTVTDAATGTSLPGVNIVVKGTSMGVVTDLNGRYSIEVPDAEAVLHFSFVGYVAEDVSVGGKSVIDVSLVPDIKSLEEVVVIGYGTVKKSDLTGSIASVTSENFQSEPVTTLTQALQGRASGVVITNNSGAPGGYVKVRIRGANSLLGNNDPLYVVDGIVLNVGIGDLNINDIESVEVLKDASATAIYGNRGANGVIMITTRRGISETPQINLDVDFGFSNLTRKYDLLDAGAYAELANVYRPNYFSAEEIAGFKENGGVDWQDEIYKTGVRQNYQLSANGGSEKTKYFVSANYLDEKGILLRSSQNRFSLRSNINSQLSRKIRLDFNLYGARLDGLNNRDNGWKGAPPWSAVIYSPTFPIYTPEGTWNRQDPLCAPNALNPVMYLEERYDGYISNSLTSSTKLSYEIVSGLTLDIVFGADFNSLQSHGYTNEWINPSSTSAYKNEYNSLFWQNSNILTYQKQFGSIHDLTLTAVYEQSQNTYDMTGASGSGINPISVGYDNLGIANSKNISSSWSQWSLRSYVGRISYMLMGRYLLTATYRADGTSKFQDPNKWGYFPSVAAAWKISEEAFLKDNTVISELKLRGSWGMTGNQEIPAYATIAQIGSMMHTWGLTQSFPGSIVNGADSPDLKWESTEQTDIGIDISVLNNRLNFSADYFVKNTNDLLFAVSIPTYEGGGNVNRNIGKMENKGFEFMLSGVPISKKDFKWEAAFNFTSLKNKLTSLGVDTFLLGNNYSPGMTQESPFCLKVGESTGSFWGYTWQGVYKSSEAAEAQLYGFNPGDNKYLDINNDSIIDSKDKHVIGTALPKVVWGFNNTFSYKNVELNLMLAGMHGNKMLNTAYAASATLLADATSISHKDGQDYWRPDNEGAEFANPASSTSQNNIESTQFVEDASFVKIKNLSLSYNIQRSVLKVLDLKIVLSVQNLYTFTNYKGYDPETSTSGTDVDGAIDVGAYPSARTFTVGLQARF